MTPSVGTRIGPYKILSPLGAGGVYRGEGLEAALEKPYSHSWLKIDPNFDLLRKNPRFQKLVAGK